MISKELLSGMEGAASDLSLGAAGEAGPGWTGRLGGQVTSHELVVLLVGLHGQCGLALETGGQVGHLQRGETRGRRLQRIKIAVRVESPWRPAVRRRRRVNLLAGGSVNCRVIALDVLSWSLRNGLKVEEHGSLGRLIGLSCRAAEVIRRGGVVAPVVDSAEVNQDAIGAVAGGVADILTETVGEQLGGTFVPPVDAAGLVILHPL